MLPRRCSLATARTMGNQHIYFIGMNQDQSGNRVRTFASDANVHCWRMLTVNKFLPFHPLRSAWSRGRPLVREKVRRE